MSVMVSEWSLLIVALEDNGWPSALIQVMSNGPRPDGLQWKVTSAPTASPMRLGDTTTSGAVVPVMIQSQKTMSHFRMI